MTTKKIKVAALDLETIADKTCLDFMPEVKVNGKLKDPAKIKLDIAEKKIKQIADMGLEPTMNLICCAGWCDEENGPQSLSIQDGTHEAEKDLLLKFWDVLENYDHFVTFNGRSFDLRCMYLHGITHGIRPSVDIDRGRYNRAGSNHTDLREILAGSGQFAKGKLDFFCKKYLGIGKLEGIDGAMIQSYFDIGLYEDIKKYNLQEVGLMFDLFKKVEIAGLLI